MSLTQLIYASRPFGYDDLVLASIFNIARRNNARDGITGSLICREDIYLQLLEGERNPVEAAYARILRDDRHAEVKLICNDAADARLFPNWAMRHDPARSWMWSSADVSAGAHMRASAEEVQSVFERVACEPA